VQRKKQVKRFFPVLLVLILGCKPAASPTSDLASPSQETRDAAAKILRATVKPPSKIKWMLRTAFIRIGENKTNVLKFLRPYNVTTQGGVRVGLGPYWEYYWLDDYWILGCQYQDDDNSLIQKELLSGWREVAVWPSTNFSGVWINYYANGQKFTEYNYKNGSRSGECIVFYRTGSKSSVWHYDNGITEGLMTYYYPTGRIQFQGQYSNNVKVGFGVSYNEDGSTNHVTDYSKP
jgi:hypothetical protein